MNRNQVIFLYAVGILLGLFLLSMALFLVNNALRSPSAPAAAASEPKQRR